ncbi:Ubiquitin fusion degradation protein 1 homolog [Caenorhabditis elegans]|uniref:Ubiquitin fusion degradation protein 1 homolog n=1 Tax=Caenorhabditis elegans TaxID=6239 RepID=Q9U3I6_CAEEL|nr:Ubiquitin fusion degradation protein 1 homolog [Caenorhabditis elegans]CAB54216.1 Ubiquitin fusion degradation protein 1 homolog [Caenorhabditis elegans]|eukprot:NP_502349.1 Ubiquitin fusion degradation protein 1 homolog [Caenorhabditis elegans]
MFANFFQQQLRRTTRHFDLIVYGPVFLPNATQSKISEINYGGKILLPSSALNLLMQYNIPMPMLFKLTNMAVQRVTHCGVLEFSAPEGQAILPLWMMQQLGLDDGDTIRIESATLPKATFAKLKPMSLEFLNITNPKAVLEVELRKYACLTKNDRIPTSYAGQTLEFLVVDLKPANSVCIIECDVNLDFDPPEGYVEQPRQVTPAVTAKPPAPDASAFIGAGQKAGGSGGTGQNATSVFGGAGRRLDGKKKPSSSVSLSDGTGVSTSNAAPVANDLPAIPPVVVNEDYKPGRVSFLRYDYKRVDVLEKELREKEASKAGQPSNVFRGGNRTLRGAR